MQSILELPSRVEVLAHYHSGSYINALAASIQQKLDAITQIYNTAEGKQVEKYCTMLTTCNCSKYRAKTNAMQPCPDAVQASYQELCEHNPSILAAMHGL